jgi:peroxiredoxin
MKLFFAGCLLAALPFALRAQTGYNYTITGVVKDMGVQHVYLSYMKGENVVVDSAEVKGATYTVNGYVDGGKVVMLKSGDFDALPTRDNMLSVFLMPGENFTITHTRIFSNAVITGSVANTEYKKLLAREKAFAGDPKDEKESVYGDYMRENPSSPLLIFAFNNYVGDPRTLQAADVPRTRALFNMLSDSVRNLASSKAFQQRLNNMVTFDQGVAIGKQAPDFTQNDTAGHPVSLSAFRGKYVLLDFWASWCGPCRADNPNVVAAYHKYHGKGFEILSVSLDQQEKAWKKAIRDDRLAWTHVSDLKYWDNALVKLYGVQGVPQNFLIDPQGKIIARGLRGEDLEKKLGEIYKN